MNTTTTTATCKTCGAATLDDGRCCIPAHNRTDRIADDMKKRASIMSQCEKDCAQAFERSMHSTRYASEAWDRVVADYREMIVNHVRSWSRLVPEPRTVSNTETTNTIATLSSLADRLVYAEESARIAAEREADEGARLDDEVPV